MAGTILKTNVATRVGVDGYELEEFEKPDGGDVAEKVKKKTIYNGPLSAVTTPTSLGAGEKFSDWDLIEVDMSLSDDAQTFFSVPLVFRTVTNSYRSYSDSGYMTFKNISDTTFEINEKTVVAGNIQRIIGIKL